MKKLTQSVLAVSLSTAMLFQNTLVVSNGEEINTSKDKNSTSIKKTDNLSKQVDPELLPNRSMGETSSMFSLGNKLPNLKTTSLLNPNSIGLGTVTTDGLNIRKAPSASSEIIDSLNKGDKVDILGRSRNWYKISVNGLYGYISASYVTLSPIEKGIDVSKWNGNIDWNKVKADGIDYVIIRGGFGNSTVDEYFKSNIEGATKAGLKVGVYWFSYATSVEKAKQEAAKCLDTIRPYKDKISYPVFYDFEYASVDYAKKLGVDITKDLSSEMAQTFISEIENEGYISGLYTNKDFGDRYFSNDILYDNNLWIAQYAPSCTYNRPYMMWQFTEKGTINGIGTPSNPAYFDINYTFLKPSKIDISSASTNKINDVTYTGDYIKPKINVTIDNKTLKENEDYTITYSNNLSVGKAHITIKGINKYTGEKTITFNINPKPVLNISSNRKTATSISLSWDKVDDVTGYMIYRHDKDLNSYTLIDKVDNNSTTYTDNNLNPATVYSYAIKSYKIVDDVTYFSDYSDIFTHSTLNKIDLSLASITEINDIIYTGDYIKPEVSVSLNNENLKENEDYTITYSNNLSVGKAQVTIKGINKYTGEKTITFNINPKSVSNISLNNKTTDSINFSWNKVDDVTGYMIYRYDKDSNSYTLLDKVDNNSTTYTDNNLESATCYNYVVKSYKVIDGVTYSSNYSDVFTESTKINKVENLKLDERYATSLKISWDKVENVDGYKIYRLNHSTNTYTLVDTIYDNDITTYTHTDRVSASNYYYRVKAFKYLNNMNRHSIYSSTLKATTKPLQPVVTLSSVKSKSINLNWTKISKNTTAYEIYMSTSKNGAYNLVGTTTNKNYTKGSLTKGKTYYFKVRAYRTVDNTKIYSSYSSVKSIVCK